jgi:hypothetical protein
VGRYPQPSIPPISQIPIIRLPVSANGYPGIYRTKKEAREHAGCFNHSEGFGVVSIGGLGLENATIYRNIIFAKGTSISNAKHYHIRDEGIF